MPKRIVVKVGTSVLTAGTPNLSRDRMTEIMRQCAALHAAGHDLILCTSGAIAAGRERHRFQDVTGTLSEKQMHAADGQRRLLQIWEQIFGGHGTQVGPVRHTVSG